MDCGVPFCQSGMLLGGMYSGCPLNNLIPEWNDLVYQGKWDLAVHRLIATNRYPEFTSRVCPALCEAACTCGMATGDPVTVKENELRHRRIRLRERRYPRRAAAGPHRQDGCGRWCRPCGACRWLTCSTSAATRSPFIEREDRPGGLLMYGIPNMKLEKWVIDRRVKILQDEGIEFVTERRCGRQRQC